MTTSNDHSIQQANIAIIGGGLAGLALAAEFCAPQFAHLSIVIIEPRSEYSRDKTWSYWRPSNQHHVAHDFSDCETAAWPAWRVQYGANRALIESSNAEYYVYASIASDTFYQAALAKIGACSHIQLLQNARVESIRSESGRAVIVLKSATNIVVNQFIFDSRLPHHTKKPHLSQHFLGIELIADKPIFASDCVDLMDFQAVQHGIHFMYVLPYSSTRALVESTWICDHADHADYTQELNAYMTKRWPNTQFSLSYTETSCLPLVPHKTTKQWLGQTQLIAIGTPAGTARAATGYAFLETLQDAKRIAQLIKTNQPVTTFRRNKIDAWMDALFLSFLQKNAMLAPKTFVQLFSHCKPASLIRFLTGQASFYDRLAVIRAMPAAPMLKHLFGFKS